MKKFWIGTGIAALLGVGIFGYLSTQQKVTSKPEEAVDEVIETPAANLTGTTVGEKLGLKGTLAANYYLFDADNFQKIKDSDTPYYLNFYANWCPTCAAQAKIDLELFNSQPDNPVVALRVNTLDTDTDADEEDLAAELGVRFQHTLIFFNAAGEETGRLLGTSSTEQIQAELNKAAGI
ncbi:thioredoxin family protein [Candidatus Berkelbacteria bacterium]|nr:thioredoxin family protein [Candidatus Berkelbacteria bacterium]